MLTAFEKYFSNRYEPFVRQIIVERVRRWADLERKAVFDRVIINLPNRYKRLPDLAAIVEAHDAVADQFRPLFQPEKPGPDSMSRDAAAAACREILNSLGKRKQYEVGEVKQSKPDPTGGAAPSSDIT
jgi:hypothetical protein